MIVQNRIWLDDKLKNIQLSWILYRGTSLKNVIQTTSKAFVRFDISACQPILECRWIHNCPWKHSSKLQLFIGFTPSPCLDVRQDWYPLPRRNKCMDRPCAVDRASKNIGTNSDMNQLPLGLQPKEVTTIYTTTAHSNWGGSLGPGPSNSTFIFSTMQIQYNTIIRIRISGIRR